jgi:hypothetical protein
MAEPSDRRHTEVDVLHIMTWLRDLVPLVQHSGHAKPTPADIKIMSVLLARQLPSAAFTIEALKVLCLGCDWWPSWNQIVEKVGALHYENTMIAELSAVCPTISALLRDDREAAASVRIYYRALLAARRAGDEQAVLAAKVSFERYAPASAIAAFQPHNLRLVAAS